MDPREEVRGFLLALLRRREGNPALSDSELLVTSGRLQSVEVIEIAVFLETRFGFDFSSRPFDQYDFDSVERIAALITGS